MTKEQLLEDLGTMQKIHYEFCQQIRKMRKAQKEWETNLANEYDEHWGKSWEKDRLEREIDEYLKKMEEER